jgi:hypothetical protein
MRASPHLRLWLTLAVAVSTTAATPARAQMIRGLVRSQTTASVIERARITATDRSGRGLGEATTDDQGRFTLVVDAQGAPFSMTVRRIGITPTSTAELLLTPADTVDYEFLVPDNPVLADTVRVTGMKSLNETRYEQAMRRGWKVFSPAEVALHRDLANSVYDLVRWAGGASLIIPSRVTECVRSARYISFDRRSDRCMVWVVDDQVLGPTPALNPADTYFMAILTASQSSMQFGDKAPWGAIVVYTRMNGDRLHP